MKQALIFTFICVVIACATTKKTSNILNGIWIPIREEVGGRELSSVDFEKQKLTIADTNYIRVAEGIGKGVIKYGNNKMDVYEKEGVMAGRHLTVIYKFENEQLTICYNLPDESYPTAFETKSKPTLRLIVFKKEKIK